MTEDYAAAAETARGSSRASRRTSLVLIGVAMGYVGIVLVEITAGNVWLAALNGTFAVGFLFMARHLRGTAKISDETARIYDECQEMTRQ